MSQLCGPVSILCYRSVSSQAVRKSAPQLSSAQSLRQGDQRGFSDVVRYNLPVHVRHYLSNRGATLSKADF